MLLQDLELHRTRRQSLKRSARPEPTMTTVTARLNLALITLAQQGDRPRCSDPIDHQRWTSDDQRDRQIAMAWCAGCPIIVECGQAADARDERWHVWGGRDYTRKPRAQQAA
jgi:hypothetical protein